MNKNILKNIFTITYNHKLSHLTSCLTTLEILEEIYDLKNEDEVFILSNGHSGLALYCLLEEKYGLNAEEMLHKHGIHPGRDIKNKLYCSTGSLGCGLPIAVGHALSEKSKNVYCIISDGECAEGSIWECLRFIHENNLTNLKVYVNINGYSATDIVDVEYLERRLLSFLPSVNIRKTSCSSFPFLNGIRGHYYVMNNDDYEKALRIINSI